MRGQVMFEEWLTPILDAMVAEQKEQGMVWTPSKMIHRMGKEIDNPDSVYYWCYKNNIPVYSPAITDGSIGDMIFFHSFKTPGLVIDLVQVSWHDESSEHHLIRFSIANSVGDGRKITQRSACRTSEASTV
jgi:deoxyhypusine synthase